MVKVRVTAIIRLDLWEWEFWGPVELALWSTAETGLGTNCLDSTVLPHGGF